jgi:single-strand DNA-binding protein
MAVNKIHIVGNMGKDPEMSYRGKDGDMAVTKVSVAVNRPKNAGTDWFNVVAFRKTAEFLNEYGAKGRKVYVEGKMRQNRWEDEDGQTHTMWELVANQVEFLDSRSGDSDPDEPDDI